MCIRKLLFISKLALVLVLGYVVAGIVFTTNMMGRNPVAFSAQSPDALCANKTGDLPELSFEDYAKIAEKNPFGSSGKLTSMSDSSVSEDLGLALYGTISGSVEVARAVIENLQTGVCGLYKIGQEVKGACIESIGTGTVVLLHNGQQKILKFNNAGSDSNGTGNTKIHSSQAGGRTSTVENTNLSTERADDSVQSRLRSVETLLADAIIEPYAVNGQVEGLKVTGLENIEAAKDLGLKNGDVIQMVNGQRLTSKQKAYQVFRKAVLQAVVDLELLRDNEARRLSFLLR
jgi:type II secretion system protein C